MNTAGETVLLQLSPSSPLKMTLSIQDLNPFVATSYYSQTFVLPGQGVNGQFFEDVFSVNGYSFDASKQASAWVLNDGFIFSIGNLNLKSVRINERLGSIEYEVFFLGDTSDFGTSVGSGFMNTINTSELTHELSYANVVASWGATAGGTAGLLNGDVLYPLCEWGYEYDANNFPTQSTLSVNFPKGSTGLFPKGGSFTNGPTSGLALRQMKPAVRVKWIFDQIFKEAGYSYESDFLNSNFFNQMYMVSDSVPRSIQIPSTSYTCTVTALPITIPRFTSSPILFPNTIANPGQNFKTPNFYSVPVNGTYTFRVKGKSTAGSAGIFKVRIFKNGVILNSQDFSTSGLGVNFTYQNSFSLLQGDAISLQIQVTPVGITGISFSNLVFECVDGPDEMQISAFFPPEGTVKKIDFIKGITTMFNLVYEPTKDQEKKFKITPWVDWIREGKILDWTDLLDGKNDTEQFAPFLNQEKELVLTGTEDGDFQNTVYQQQFKRSYLYREYNSEINLIKGTNTKTVPFAATPLESIPARGAQYPTWIIPSLGKFQPGNPEENRAAKIQPIQPKPRILFYNGLKPNPVSWYLDTSNSVGATGTAQDFYPLVSPYETFPPEQFTFDLNFQSKTALWSPASGYNGQTATDLYTEYWEDYTNWIYDPFNRVKIATMRMDPYVVENLKFNDIIWVKDCWYFVTKIIDYPVGERDLVKVELIKVPPKSLPNIPQGASGPAQGECMRVALCNNNSPYSPVETNTWTYADCDNNLQTIYVPNQSCAYPCLLFPNVFTLPPGWSMIPIGPCSGITPGPADEEMLIDLSAPGDAGMEILLLIEGATGGTAGTYIPMQYYHMTAIDAFTGISFPVPYNYGFRATLEWTNGATGVDFVEGSAVILYENTIPVASDTHSGPYAGPISAQYPAGITAADYLITAFIQGATLQPGCPVWSTDTDTWGTSQTVWNVCPENIWNEETDIWNLSEIFWNT